ncbi:hypothetical protein BCR43DRAFT_491278 [Syncephalastrum racemosum]|uniref:Uncharacterized protein n=1 Tax=Syncephalastrum racemosum TaxID=13706 RepID=A0A1X2HBU1_SYNRA|nr:hypothetical protein BCR43DRAFT_491278 [Syncephalastrum racemosum]
MAQPLPPSPPQPSHHNQTGHKKPVRHHVKRRSTGRVHVTKLAPMARVNSAHTDTEVDDQGETTHRPRPGMRRSQSQRSLNRLSTLGAMTRTPAAPPSAAPASERSNGNNNNNNNNTSTTSSTAVAEDTPPTTPRKVVDESTDENTTPSPSVSSPAVLRKQETKANPAFFVTQSKGAAPVEQTFHAVANNLQPDTKAIHHPPPTTTTTTTNTPTPPPTHLHPSKHTQQQQQRQPLRSQFVDDHALASPTSSSSAASASTSTLNAKRQPPSSNLSNVASAATAQPPGISRTQQKLLLQRQHCFVDDENTLAHPRNMLRLTRELERVGREYRCVRRYQDPMLESLARCFKHQQGLHDDDEPANSDDPTEPRPPSRTRSYTALPPEAVQPKPHSEQRRTIHRRHQHLKMLAAAQEYQHSQHHHIHAQPAPDPISTSTSSPLSMIRWSAGVLLERMWSGSQ